MNDAATSRAPARAIQFAAQWPKKNNSEGARNRRSIWSMLGRIAPVSSAIVATSSIHSGHRLFLNGLAPEDGARQMKIRDDLRNEVSEATDC